MNIGQYTVLVAEVKALLKECNILKQSYDKNGTFSQEYLQSCESNDLTKIYLTAIKNFDYDILLFDDSIIQFSFSIVKKKTVLRYAYYQNPFDVLSYSEYLTQELEQSEFDLVSRVIETEYDQIVSEAPPLRNILSIRYDYSLREYTEGVHPVSHFHFGLENKIKVPLCSILTPVAFGIFIIKQVYYDRWKLLITTPALVDKFKQNKVLCEAIDPQYFKGKDKYEPYLI